MNKYIFSGIIAFIFFGSFSFKSINQDASNHVKFKIKNAGINVDGYFKTFSSDIVYDKTDLKKCKFNGTITVSTINTGIDSRDNHLKKEEYFDATKYPQIKFTSTSIEKGKGNNLKVTGDLTVKKTTKKVTLDVTVSETSDKFTYNTNLKINRRDYGVGTKSWIMSDDVNISINITKYIFKKQ